MFIKARGALLYIASAVRRSRVHTVPMNEPSMKNFSGKRRSRRGASRRLPGLLLVIGTAATRPRRCVAAQSRPIPDFSIGGVGTSMMHTANSATWRNKAKILIYTCIAPLEIRSRLTHGHAACACRITDINCVYICPLVHICSSVRTVRVPLSVAAAASSKW